MPPPFTQGRLGFSPAQSGVYVTDAWLAGQQKAHLCAASNIRAMPETEIPPAMRGEYYYCLYKLYRNGIKCQL